MALQVGILVYKFPEIASGRRIPLPVNAIPRQIDLNRMITIGPGLEKENGWEKIPRSQLLNDPAEPGRHGEASRPR